VEVQLDHVAHFDALPGSPPQELLQSKPPAPGRSEPEGPDLSSVARWLQTAFADEPHIEAAVLTGSALDPAIMRRFSDIDLVLLVQQEVSNPRWIELTRQLRLRVPKLSVTVDLLADLSGRAPLLTCRLLREQILVRGQIDGDVLPWPCLDDLRFQGKLWAQEAAAALWHRLTDPVPRLFDPIREAWIASKYALQALRYRYLLMGERETATRAIVARAQCDCDLALPWLADVLDALEVAREHKPPPSPEEGMVVRYFSAAL